MTYSLKDYYNAYKKVAGLFVPTRLIWRPFGELLEVDRCAVDGALVTNSQASLSQHLGHTMRQPVQVTLIELIKIWLRIIA